MVYAAMNCVLTAKCIELSLQLTLSKVNICCNYVVGFLLVILKDKKLDQQKEKKKQS